MAVLWPLMAKLGAHIDFAYSSFKWSNLAANNAGITVVIVGFGVHQVKTVRLYDVERDGEASVRKVPDLNGIYSGSGYLCGKNNETRFPPFLA